MARFKLASYAPHAGSTRLVRIAKVTHYVDYVTFNEESDIVFRKFTKDYSGTSARPFMLTKSRRQFKTLEAAVKALVKEA